MKPDNDPFIWIRCVEGEKHLKHPLDQDWRGLVWSITMSAWGRTVWIRGLIADSRTVRYIPIKHIQTCVWIITTLLKPSATKNQTELIRENGHRYWIKHEDIFCMLRFKHFWWPYNFIFIRRLHFIIILSLAHINNNVEGWKVWNMKVFFPFSF